MEFYTIMRVLLGFCWLIGIVSAIIAKKRNGDFQTIAASFIFGLIAIPAAALVIWFFYASFMLIFFGPGTY